MLGYCSSRANPSLLQKLSDSRIDVVTIPTHTSHIVQPLDLTVNASLKASLRASCKKRGQNLRRSDLIQSTREALYHALYPETITNGIKRAGIHPLDQSLVLNHPCTLQSNPSPPSPIVADAASKSRSKKRGEKKQ